MILLIVGAPITYTLPKLWETVTQCLLFVLRVEKDSWAARIVPSIFYFWNFTPTYLLFVYTGYELLDCRIYRQSVCRIVWGNRTFVPKSPTHIAVSKRHRIFQRALSRKWKENMNGHVAFINIQDAIAYSALTFFGYIICIGWIFFKRRKCWLNLAGVYANA